MHAVISRLQRGASSGAGPHETRIRVLFAKSVPWVHPKTTILVRSHIVKSGCGRARTWQCPRDPGGPGSCESRREWLNHDELSLDDCPIGHGRLGYSRRTFSLPPGDRGFVLFPPPPWVVHSSHHLFPFLLISPTPPSSVLRFPAHADRGTPFPRSAFAQLNSKTSSRLLFFRPFPMPFTLSPAPVSVVGSFVPMASAGEVTREGVGPGWGKSGRG